MERQYSKNLKIILVNEPSTSGENVSSESYLNFINDHELNEIPFIVDKDSKLAAKYGVVALPTTLLITDGKLLRKWENLALPGELAMAIEERLSK